MAAAILDVEHLTVCRDGATVVEDVSFSLPPESDTALVGPNGAGKSSLVQALLGILPRRSGTIRLLGHSLGPRGQLPVAVRDRIAYLPQSLSLRGRIPLTVAEFVGLGFDRPGLALPWRSGTGRAAAVRRALGRTDSSDLTDRLISELSTGQLKRVLLAFCVVRPRSLLLLDEAQAGLDSQATEPFLTLL